MVLGALNFSRINGVLSSGVASRHNNPPQPEATEEMAAAAAAAVVVLLLVAAVNQTMAPPAMVLLQDSVGTDLGYLQMIQKPKNGRRRLRSSRFLSRSASAASSRDLIPRPSRHAALIL